MIEKNGRQFKMDPLPNHMVKDKDDGVVKLFKGKELLQLSKDDDFQGYALNTKP